MKLPVPAPPVFAGVAGIVGLWLGYDLIVRFWGQYDQLDKKHIPGLTDKMDTILDQAK